jgi:hypothetical protein
VRVYTCVVRVAERDGYPFSAVAALQGGCGRVLQQQEARLSLGIVDDGIVGRILPTQQQIWEELQRIIPPQEGPASARE